MLTPTLIYSLLCSRSRLSLLKGCRQTNMVECDTFDQDTAKIDPFDNLKSSSISIESKGLKYVNLPRSAGTPLIDDASTKNMLSISTYRYLTNSTAMSALQTDSLQNLPYAFYEIFMNLLDQLVPRVALISLTYHVMILVPTLKFLKLNFNMSIIPFLYLGAVVVAVPFIACYLWESNFVDIGVINDKLKTFLDKEKLAASRLRREYDNLNLNDPNNTQIDFPNLFTDSGATDNEDFEVRELRFAKNLVSIQLLSKIDVDALYTEIIAIKQSKSGSRYSTLSTSSTKSIASNRWLSDTTMKSANEGEQSVSIATKRLLDGLSYTENEGQSNSEDILAGLKELQEDLKRLDGRK